MLAVDYGAIMFLCDTAEGERFRRRARALDKRPASCRAVNTIPLRNTAIWPQAEQPSALRLPPHRRRSGQHVGQSLGQLCW